MDKGRKRQERGHLVPTWASKVPDLNDFTIAVPNTYLLIFNSFILKHKHFITSMRNEMKNLG